MNERINRVINIAQTTIVFFGLLECIYAILQIFEIMPSNHPKYKITGTFYNPGPFSCFLAFILPMAISASYKHANKYLNPIYYLFIFLSILLILITISRTAIIASTLGCILSCKTKYYKRFFSLGNLKKIVLFSCILVIGLMLYFIKKDSADGRIFIWKIAWQAALKDPLVGSGWEKVAGNYGNAQENFFLNGEGTLREIYLADSPSYVFNEFLQIAIAYGFPIAIIFFTLLLICFFVAKQHKFNGLRGSLASFVFIALASYPLQFVEFKIILSIILMLSVMCINTKKIKFAAVILCVFYCIIINFGTNNININKLVDEAIQRSRRSEYSISNNILKKASNYTSHIQPFLLLGRNYEALCMKDSAEKYYYKAHYRIPNRILPHYCLMNLYKKYPEDSTKLIYQAKLIEEKKLKVYSLEALEMKQEALEVLYGVNYKLKTDYKH